MLITIVSPCSLEIVSTERIRTTVKVTQSKSTGRSPGSSFGCESLQPANRNVAPFKDRLDVILEAFILSTNTPMA